MIARIEKGLVEGGVRTHLLYEPFNTEPLCLR